MRKWIADLDPARCHLMMQEPIRRVGYAEALVQSEQPRLFAYLNRYEQQLRKRAAFIRYYKPTDAFWSMFNTSSYTFAPYKVVWPSIASRIEACVITNGGMVTGELRVVIPQHILTMVAFEDPTEANYFCAVVNSSLFDFAIRCYSQEGGKSFGTPHVLQLVRVPRYTGAQAQRDLAALGVEAHRVAGGEPGRPLPLIETDIDEQAASMWGLTSDELLAVKAELLVMNQ